MSTMNRLTFRTFPILALALLAGCSDHERDHERDLSAANLTQAMNDYLARRGELCLAKNAWPVVVTEAESRARSRNALQMPVLERLGLVTASDALVEQASEDGVKSPVHARRYALSAEGRKYYLARPAHKTPAGNRFAEADHDFCAVRLTLDRVVGWEASNTPGAKNEAVVTYTYKVDPAPWTADQGLRTVFPMVDAVIRGAGSMQLKEGMVLGAHGWEAKDL
jgi:hypothetical protein